MNDTYQNKLAVFLKPLSDVRSINLISLIIYYLCGFIIIFSAFYYIVNLPYFNLRNINVINNGVAIDLANIQNRLNSNNSANNNSKGQVYSFFSLSLAEIRDAFEQQPSIKKVDIMRQYPNTIDITIYPQEYFAKWGNNYEDNLYISSDGKIYPGSDYDKARTSIELYAYSNDHAQFLVDEYKRLNKLFKSKIISLTYNQQNNFNIKLADQTNLIIENEGADIMRSKINFWYKSWQKLKQNPDYQHIKYFDLRHTGFTMRL
jgi:cell division septal protein FtsQ